MLVKGLRHVQKLGYCMAEKLCNALSSTKGCGTKDNPMKIVRQYWSLKGELLAESK